MPKVTVLPHPGICPNGAEFKVPEGANLAKALVANGVNMTTPASSPAPARLATATSTRALILWNRQKTMKKICLTRLGV